MEDKLYELIFNWGEILKMSYIIYTKDPVLNCSEYSLTNKENLKNILL